MFGFVCLLLCWVLVGVTLVLVFFGICGRFGCVC